MIIEAKDSLKELKSIREIAEKKRKDITKRCKAARLKLAKSGKSKTNSSSTGGTFSNSTTQAHGKMAPPRPVSLNVDAIDIVVAEEAIAVEVTNAKLKESQMAREEARGSKARYQKEANASSMRRKPLLTLTCLAIDTS